MYQIRTDLAVETQEKMQEDHIELKGVRCLQETVDRNLTVSTVLIETENGAKLMGKPKGTYITIEAGDMDEEDEGYHRKISGQLAKTLKELVPDKKRELSILVVGLGNREVTPDSLGPKVADNLCITRHIIKEFGRYAFGEEAVSQISSIVPGVMAQTGMESSEIVAAVVQETKPDAVLVIDALAARNIRRLGRTIQVTDTGINPGSGVGNHRHALNRKSLGIPVIAVGIPTVVDAATIVSDAMSDLLAALGEDREAEAVGRSLSRLSETEQYELFHELLAPSLNTMFVTPKDIDEQVKRLSYTVSEAINMAFAEKMPR